MTRALGIDFGLRRVGIAMSDPLQIIATRHSCMEWNGKDIDDLVERINKLCHDNDVDTIVIGYPLRTDGVKGVMTELTDKFVKKLESSDCKLVLMDERYTSKEAKRFLQSSGSNKLSSDWRNKGMIDSVAAEIILQDYLEENRARF